MSIRNDNTANGSSNQRLEEPLPVDITAGMNNVAISEKRATSATHLGNRQWGENLITNDYLL